VIPPSDGQSDGRTDGQTDGRGTALNAASQEGPNNDPRLFYAA